MHPEVTDFLIRVKMNYSDVFRGRVFEAGSMDVNGTPRPFFDATEYVGADWRPGPGVDWVGLIHDYTVKPDGYFDTVVSTETLEHDPNWPYSVNRMVDLVRVGGSLVITCAGPGREPHCVETAPPTSVGTIKTRYYGNLSLRDLLGQILNRADFRVVVGEDDPKAHDTRVLAYQKLGR